MSDTKFTPGPWKYDRGECAIISQADGLPLNAVYIVSLLGAMGGRDTDADARLIAAAPRLYHALEELAIHAEHWCPPHSEIVAEAKAALAAARGEHD